MGLEGTRADGWMCEDRQERPFDDIQCLPMLCKDQTTMLMMTVMVVMMVVVMLLRYGR